MSLCLSVENIKKMKKYLIYMFALLLGSTLFTACSESDDEVDEYPNWRATNEAYFNSLYATAKQRVAAGDAQWKVLKSWSLGEKATDKAEDHIVARVISEGTGTERPLFTDSVRVHYRGRLLPSTSYADGYVFDQTYYGNFNPASAMPAKKAVAGVTAGFGTALQHMHIGDRWEVTIPYQLAYGEQGGDPIPGYSVLVFDMTLAEIHHPGKVVPPFKAKKVVSEK